MVEFIYNNAKNANLSYTLFEFNCSYDSWILYKDNVIFCYKFKLANKLLAKLRELIIVYLENL